MLVLIRRLLRAEERKKRMIKGEKLVEEMCNVVVGEAHALELVGVVLLHVIGASPLQVKKRRDGLVGAHEGRVAGMRVGRGGAVGDGGVDLVVLVEDVALGASAGDVAAQAVNLLFHLCVLGALAHTLEVGLDLAF